MSAEQEKLLNIRRRVASFTPFQSTNTVAHYDAKDLLALYDTALARIEVLTRERDEARETLKTATLSWGVYIAAETDDERDEAYEMMKDSLTDKPGAA